MDFVNDDEFTVGDLFECLRFANGELQFSSDYLRGRCMKTDITVMSLKEYFIFIGKNNIMLFLQKGVLSCLQSLKKSPRSQRLLLC